MGQTEVTQGLYQMVMGSNPSQNKEGPSFPVEQVSWMDAIRFCNRMSELEGMETCYQIQGSQVKWEAGITCTGYRLPTEAEWEYAAKAGTDTNWAGSDVVENVGWHAMNAQGRTHEVRERRTNQWGLNDMSGNVHEWVWDFYGPYETDVTLDPRGPVTGSYRVLRGGDWYHLANRARVSARDYAAAELTAPYIGFRVVRSRNK